MAALFNKDVLERIYDFLPAGLYTCAFAAVVDGHVFAGWGDWLPAVRRIVPTLEQLRLAGECHHTPSGRQLLVLMQSLHACFRQISEVVQPETGGRMYFSKDRPGPLHILAAPTFTELSVSSFPYSVRFTSGRSTLEVDGRRLNPTRPRDALELTRISAAHVDFFARHCGRGQEGITGVFQTADGRELEGALCLKVLQTPTRRGWAMMPSTAGRELVNSPRGARSRSPRRRPVE